tara:strand:- start:23441 stop:24733 length:1293 start_codon:yes stop_codon:yes gene_type:complete
MKNILLCMHNFFVVINLQFIIKDLAKNYSITLVTTSQNLNHTPEEIEILKKKLDLKKIIILPLYIEKKKNFSSLVNSFKTIKQLLNNNSFISCIVDNNLDIWTKVITNDFKKKNKKIIGIKHDSLALNTEKVEEFLLNGNIENILNSTHKLREIKSKININSNSLPKQNKLLSLFKKLKRFNNLFLERYLIPYIFFKKTFGYSKLDLSTGFDDKTINNIICLFYTGYVFWGSLYNFKKTYYVKYKNNCTCSKMIKKNKKKILFLGSLLWESDTDLLSNQINNLIKFVTKILLENKEITELDIKLHPEEKLENKSKIIKLLSESKIPIKINYIDQISLIEHSCDYYAAFGMLSSALFYVSSSCKFIDVYCLKSLSDHRYKKYYLKLFNENIIFYDDINNCIENQSEVFNQMVFDKNIEKKDIIDVIKNILD